MITGMKVRRKPERFTEEWLYQCKKAGLPPTTILTVRRSYSSQDVGFEEIELGWRLDYFIPANVEVQEEYI